MSSSEAEGAQAAGLCTSAVCPEASDSQTCLSPGEDGKRARDGTVSVAGAGACWGHAGGMVLSTSEAPAVDPSVHSPVCHHPATPRGSSRGAGRIKGQTSVCTDGLRSAHLRVLMWGDDSAHLTEL